MSVRNIVAIGELGKRIEIEKLASRLSNVLYEPEQFPGAMYYPEELEGASVLVFASGKVIFAGLKNPQLLKVARGVLGKLGKLGFT